MKLRIENIKSKQRGCQHQSLDLQTLIIREEGEIWQKKEIYKNQEWLEMPSDSSMSIQLILKENSKYLGSLTIPLEMIIDYKNENPQQKCIKQWVQLYQDIGDDMFDGSIGEDDNLDETSVHSIQIMLVLEN